MLQSYVDRVDRYGAAGWACDDAHPQAPLHLLVLDNDRLVARVLANRYRADLEAAGIGNGRHGFEVEFPAALPASERHVVRICREADGADLERSPVVLDPPPPSSAMARELLAEMLAGEPGDDELASLIDCMVEWKAACKSGSDSILVQVGQPGPITRA